MTPFAFLRTRADEASLRQQIANQSGLLQEARRSIADLELAIEDRGWTRWGNDHKVDGLSLESIKDSAEELRAWVAGGGIMKRIIELRGTYVYGDGVGFKGIPDEAKPFFDNENNVAKVFSVTALQEINRAHGTDGQIVFLVHKKSHEIIRLPLDQMESPYVDADDPERIWYIRRAYTRPTVAHPEGEKYDKYIRATTAPSHAKKQGSVQAGPNETVEIDSNYTALVWRVNGQTGWLFGIPDLFASLQWAEKYTGYLKNQDRFAEALASIAWQYKGATGDQAKKMAATIATARGDKTVAGTQAMTEGMEAKPLPGNSDVTFANGDPLAGQAAAAGEVPLEAVLGKSMTNAGGKLDPDMVRMVNSRRESAMAFFRSLGKLLNAPELEPFFPDVESETPFREAQMYIAGYGQGLFEPDEIRGPLAAKLRIPLKEGSTAPKDAIVPNTQRALDAAAKATAANKPTPSGDANNGQGHDALGVGKLSDGDNTSRDKGEV